MDFTFKKYTELLLALQQAGYIFFCFEDYLTQKDNLRVDNERFIILRHDVDELSKNALKLALFENRLGIKSTYYFRIVKQSNNPNIIKQIAALGHEIGYHYEDLSFANGDFEKAIDSFQINLKYFRTFYPIKTVCMHGSSTSKYDNRLLWEYFKLEDFGLLGEPYLSINFDKMFYLTDTGYAWDGGQYAVRDVVENKFGITFHTTNQIINSISEGTFPKQNLILAHTLWTNNYLQWFFLHFRELLRNNVKKIARSNKLVMKIYSSLVKMYWKK